MSLEGFIEAILFGYVVDEVEHDGETLEGEAVGEERAQERQYLVL